MTPKEKAEELINMFSPHAKNWDCFYDIPLDENHAKQCALRAVDIVQKLPNIQYDSIQYNNNDESQYDYWEEVKQELEKL